MSRPENLQNWIQPELFTCQRSEWNSLCNPETPKMASTAAKKISITSEITKYGLREDDFS